MMNGRLLSMIQNVRSSFDSSSIRMSDVFPSSKL